MSDDDDGITAVEAAGGERVQLQRIQCAVVLTFCKHPEDGTADVRRLHLEDFPLLSVNCTSEIEPQKSHLFVLGNSAFPYMLR